MKKIKMHSDLVKLHELLRDELKHKWGRVLSFGEELSDRWEKARYLNFGRGASIYDSALVFGDVEVGEKTWVGPFVLLDGSGGLKIGANCSISAGVQIYSHDSVKWALSKGKAKYDYAKVEIGDCCYIGPNAVISRGVVIGNYCVVGANGFVNKDIPDYSVVFGTPARVMAKVAFDRKNSPVFIYPKSKKAKKPRER